MHQSSIDNEWRMTILHNIIKVIMHIFEKPSKKYCRYCPEKMANAIGDHHYEQENRESC